jgi:hypothetical protein
MTAFAASHLRGDLPGDHRAGFAVSQHPQPEQLRLAARSAIIYPIGERHGRVTPNSLPG